jgi:hypothetical protein
VEEGERVVVEVFPILGEPAAAVEPCDRAFNDPALGFDNEAFSVISAPDDLHRQAAHRAGGAILKPRPGVGAVREQLAQERELPEQGGQQENPAVTVLNVSRGHQRVQHQPECVDQDVALLAVDQLAGIKAVRVDGRAPFSALFTLWLSITQAVGLASRSACSRHLT